MSKEWKCGDCCCFKTDSCLFGEMDENSTACSETVVDHEKAYQQGRNDAIEEFVDWLSEELILIHLFPEERARLYKNILEKVNELKEKNNE